MNAIFCPECGAKMTLRKTTKFSYKNKAPRLFYGCSRWPDCSGIHGAHPDGRPLGFPADKPTKEARIRAHEAFDVLWKTGKYKRGEAYKMLAKLMEREVVHFGEFDLNECEMAIRLLKKANL